MAESAEQPIYDLAIVGGGIYGALTLMNASQRGLRSVLLEQEAVGCASTANNFRTLHGGLRSLQGADLPRFFEGVAQRRWFLAHFPKQTSVKRFVLPLSGQGIYRPSIMRIAGLLNDGLSLHRNRGVAATHHIPSTQILSAQSLEQALPSLAKRRAAGAFCWFDGQIDDLPSLLEDIRQRSHTGPGTAEILERHQVLSIERQGQEYQLGVRATKFPDRLIQARRVVDTTGLWPTPWQPALGLRPRYHQSLAWNLIFNKPALSADAIGFKTAAGQMVFVRDWQGQLYAGTGHAPLDAPLSSMSQVRERVAPLLPGFVADLSMASGIELTIDDISELQCGVLPVARLGSTKLATRPATAWDSRNAAVHVTGVKFTTAPGVTQRLAKRLSRASR